jgi:hypothetical protein
MTTYDLTPTTFSVSLSFSVQDYPPSMNGLTLDECERIIISLLLESVFEPKVVWGPYE